MPRIALVTAAEAVSVDADLPPLVEALTRRRLDAEPAVWTDPSVDWPGYDLAVVRSAWDYPMARDEFLAWAIRTAVATPVLNPPEVLAWNTDKRYLEELDVAGVPIVPTSWIGAGHPVELPDGDVVVKPAVGAGSIDAARFGPGARGRAALHAAALVASGRVAMVQPYLAAVDSDGERGLVYIEGEYSHAFTKGPMLSTARQAVAGLFAEETIVPAEATPEEREVADAAASFASERFGTLLYTRVDLIDGGAGSPVVVELELAEPSLYHDAAPESADRLAAAIAARLRG
jgi:glutathione synthase/RimK-type ligase-like ATP-grasp enzyme